MANAALIAAAPELLDALEAAMEANRLAFNALNTDRYGHSLSGRTEKEIARMALYEAKNDYAMAAIAKARGE
jgi:hypothetical protein